MLFSQLLPIKKSWIFVLIAGFVFFSTCKKEEDEEPPVTIMGCENLAEIKQTFSAADANDNLITELREENDAYLFSFEDNSSISVDKACFEQVIEDPEDWRVNLIYTDNTQQQPGFVGALEIERVLDPNGACPLHAQVSITARRKGKIRIKVRGQHGPDSDVIIEKNSLELAHTVDVLGLYPDALNVVEFYVLSANDRVRIQDTLQIQTEEIPYSMPIIEVDIAKTSQMEPGWTLVSHRGVQYSPNVPFMMDHFGDIRWYLDFYGDPRLGGLGYDVGMERLQNGNFYFGDYTTDKLYEVTMYGEIINSWELPGYTYHHNVIEKPDGNFLVTVNKNGSTHSSGVPTVEDYIIEIDRESEEIIKEWDLKESLDENRDIWYQNAGGPADWIHVNALVYDETDNTIILSGRLQGVVKIDYSNNVKWILSPHEDWGENRRGEDLNQYLLSPLNASGLPITDQNVILGYENHPEFEWNWYQHAPLTMSSGNIMLFDNGDYRNFNQALRYSRAVEFQIDEEAMTVQQIWAYGKERGYETFAPIVSDVDYHPTQNNILFAPGIGVDNGGGLSGGKVVEIDYNTKEVVFEARIISPGITFHRVERMPLYPE